MSYGFEWIIDGSYNSAVRVLVLFLGPMEGSYIGPYPTKTEAIAALSQSSRISISELATDLVVIGDLTLTLDGGVGKDILGGTARRGFYEHPDMLADIESENGPATASVYRKTCLILRLPRLFLGIEADSGPDALLVLIDTEAGRPFAFYNEGPYHHLATPARWDK